MKVITEYWAEFPVLYCKSSRVVCLAYSSVCTSQAPDGWIWFSLQKTNSGESYRAMWVSPHRRTPVTSKWRESSAPSWTGSALRGCFAFHQTKQMTQELPPNHLSGSCFGHEILTQFSWCAETDLGTGKLGSVVGIIMVFYGKIGNLWYNNNNVWYNKLVNYGIIKCLQN